MRSGQVRSHRGDRRQARQLRLHQLAAGRQPDLRRRPVRSRCRLAPRRELRGVDLPQSCRFRRRQGQPSAIQRQPPQPGAGRFQRGERHRPGRTRANPQLGNDHYDEQLWPRRGRRLWRLCARGPDDGADRVRHRQHRLCFRHPQPGHRRAERGADHRHPDAMRRLSKRAERLFRGEAGRRGGQHHRQRHGRGRPLRRSAISSSCGSTIRPMPPAPP